MPKINLLNKIKKQQLKKHTASQNSVWIIEKDQNNKDYYVMKADTTRPIVVWTDNKLKALRFHTEKGCQHFIKDHLGGRTDIHLRWIADK